MTRLSLPAVLESLKPACSFIREGAQQASLSEDDCGKLDLVVEELVVNVARYGYPDGNQGAVDLRYDVLEPGRLIVEICDSGVAFNPLDSNPPDFSRGLAERPVGGLGIFLVQSIAESISYSRVDGQNIISFRIATSSTGPYRLDSTNEP
jgi:anti-sigma regulatory factor (Ser/Thr protein kinase)